MNAERLTEIRERWAKSNFEDPAPWRVVDRGDGYADVRDAEGYRVTPDVSHVYDPTVIAVAAAPTDIADLLAEVERLRVTMEVAIEHYDLMLEDGFHDCEAWEEVRDRLVRAIRGSEIEGGEPRNLEVIP